MNDLNEIIGTINDDSLESTSNNDFIDGLSGDDTVIYSGDHADYSFARDDDRLEIDDQRTGTNDGTDTLQNVEYIQFADQLVEEDKVDIVHTYDGEFHDFQIFNSGDGVYEIETDDGFVDLSLIHIWRCRRRG